MGTITVNRTELGKALDFASLGLAKRPTIPVLAGLLVEISAAGLQFSAFDYETSASVKVAGEADGAGRVLVLGAELAAVVKSLPKGARVTAELTAEDDGLIVLCDGIEAVLSALPLNEYPKLPAVPAETGLVAGDAFAKAVTRVAAAAGTDDTLPSLLCVKLTGDAGRLELAATDRYRLAVDSLTWTGPDGTDALIPAKTLVTFGRKADKRGKIELHIDAERAGFSDGTRTLITRTIQGEFPKFRSLIPEDGQLTATVLVVADALKSAIERAAKLVERNMPVYLDVADDSITVKAMVDGEAASSQVVPAVLDGDPFEIRFCPEYIASMLAGVDGEAFVGMVSTTKPVRVTSADEASAFTGVCMPVRQNT